MRRATRIRLLIFAVIGGLAILNAGVRYTGLYQLVFPSTYAVRVHLASSGGLFPHAEVTWRGVTVGQVTGLDFQTDGVVATVAIDDRYRIPTAVDANVHNRSAVGEQYLDLVPTTASGPDLHDGSVIGTAHTTTPIRDEQVIAALDQLERSVDLGDLRTVIDQSGVAFSGSSSSIRRLIQNSRTILATAQQALPATQSLLRSGRTVLGTQAAQAPLIRSSINDLDTLFGTFATHTGEIGTILRTGTTATRVLAAFANRLAPQLPGLLRNLTTLAGLAGSRIPGINETLAVLPWALAMAQTPGREGYAHFTFVGSNTPGPCQVGYLLPSQWLSPLSNTVSTLPERIGCDEPLSTLPRGANSVHPNRS